MRELNTGRSSACMAVFLKFSVHIILFSLFLNTAHGMVYVLTPENATFQYADADAAFGGDIPPEGIRGVLQRADPLDGCEPLVNQVPHSGHNHSVFAIVERGGCVFDVKVAHAQKAGFAAVIVFNNEFGRELITMVAVSGRHASDIAIPAVFVTNASGRQLLSVIGQPGTVCVITPTFDSTAWSVMAVSFISLVAISAVMAAFFFVRRHRLRRVGSRLVLQAVGGGGANGSPADVLSERDVRGLPSVVFSKAAEGGARVNGTAETCAVCLDDYEEGEKLRVLPCDHEFHIACVDQWLTTRRPFCPVCKRDARRSDADNSTESTPLLSAIQQQVNATATSIIGNLTPTTAQVSPVLSTETTSMAADTIENSQTSADEVPASLP